MLKQPVRLIKLTEEKVDRLIEILDIATRQGNSDAEEIAADIYLQQSYNPSDVQIKYIPPTEKNINSLAKAILIANAEAHRNE